MSEQSFPNSLRSPLGFIEGIGQLLSFNRNRADLGLAEFQLELWLRGALDIAVLLRRILICPEVTERFLVE